MSTTRTDGYYLPRGDLVLQVENTLFKLPSSILEMHSDFFHDLLATSSSDTREGTSDEYPLHISQDLCSADSFATICSLIFPKISLVDPYPSILRKDFEKWHPVLQATDALQMVGVHNYILVQLQKDGSGTSFESARLLGWLLRSAATFDDLKFECFCALVYRRRPLSEADILAIGAKATAQVMRARERIRVVIFDYRSFTGSMSIAPGCNGSSGCRYAVMKYLIRLLSKTDTSSDSDTDNSSILDMPVDDICINEMACAWCRPAPHIILGSLRKAKLDGEIRPFAASLGTLLAAPTIKVGDKIGEGDIPHGTFGTVLYTPELDDHSACGVPTKISTEAWADKKPTCHVNHLPPYLQKYDEIKAKGVDLIVCIAANDPFVLSGWGRIEGVVFASDPEGRWSSKCGLGLDLTEKDLGKRTGRYVLILDKLVVKHVATEPDPTQVQVSGAEHVLDALNKIA